MTAPASTVAACAMTAPAHTAAGRACSQQEFYAIACDPARHVVVEACAGSGKTWLLVSRILRALLDGTPPQEILAITFTRKAAGEMRQRLHDWLTDGARCSPAQRVQALRDRGLDQGQAERLAPALAQLHGQLLACGRTVQINTFHAWFFQLLLGSPRELLDRLGLHAGMALIEDEDELRPELMRRFHSVVMRDAAALADYTALLQDVGRSRLDDALAAALDKRIEIELAESELDLTDAVPSAAAWRPDQAEWGQPGAISVLSAAARAMGAHPNKKPAFAGAALQAALAMADPALAFQAARDALFTREDEPRQLGDIDELHAAVRLLQELASRAEQQRAHEHHGRMLRLARLLLACWRELKRARGLADMPDLERCALACLSDPQASGGLLQRLDLRVRQVMIDEFQDSSPLQWQALWSWLSSYAGAGGGASGQRPPALFIVGDPKQSIYRFRRAEPRVFEAACQAIVQGLAGIVLCCDQTRRNSPGIVAGLNQVFGQAMAGGDYAGFRPHGTDLPAAAGPALRRLPRVMRDERPVPAATGPGWRDTLATPRSEAETVLRSLEAAHVARAVDELVRGQGLAPGRIMVLARKRAMLARVAQALRERDLPHVAAEDLRLGDLPEARDLIALLDVIASPGHDLALAQVLKCPYFGAGDEQLLWLSQRARRSGLTWWAALMDWTDAPAELDQARRRLAAWARAAPTLPPHDLLDRMLHQGDLMARALAAAPPSRRGLARLALESVLAQALALDGGRYGTPYNLVRGLRNRPISVAAMANVDAVQLLTVHGAKGLEADVVFVLDTDAPTQQRARAAVMVDWPVQARAPQRVAFVANEARVPPSLQALAAAEAALLAREELNLLYVAMTRARQQLVVSATQAHRAGAARSWWSRLEAWASPWRPQPSGPDAGGLAPAQVPMLPPGPGPLQPAWTATGSAPGPARRGGAAEDPAAARLGQAVHRWLEWAAAAPVATSVDRARWAEAAAAECGVPAGSAGRVLQLASQVLDSASCARFFDARRLSWAGNEVPLADAGELLRIDRLVQLADDGVWWVLDYKLNAEPQAVQANRAQLLRYRRAVQALQPGQSVRAAFITAGGRLVELEDG